METPRSPIDFARRARKLYGEREAVVDGNLRLTYEQFFDRCDRWSSLLQKLGVTQGDRVAYIAPNTHAQLESFYAVPQIGAVLVPINYSLTPDDFVYLINHSGAKIVCAHSDYLAAVESVRAQLPGVGHFIALEGSHRSWLDYEELLAEGTSDTFPGAGSCLEWMFYLVISVTRSAASINSFRRATGDDAACQSAIKRTLAIRFANEACTNQLNPTMDQ